MPQIVLSAIYFALTLGFVLLMALFLVWWERKVSAHIQVRFGPMMTGKWHGWSQTLADALKLLQKEDIVPGAADKRVYFWAPVIVFGATMMTFVVIPWSPTFIAADLNVGILYIIAITTFTIISLLMAGWGSNNKYSLLGGMRSAAQIVSYEVPLTLSIMGVVMLAQSLSMQDIVADQDKFWNWNIIRQPLGFLVYLVAATAEVNRTPFDLPEAEQELVAGFNIEYSGMKFAMFFLAEFVNMFVVAAIATTLFLGGWWGPFGNESLGWLWFVLKSLGVVFVLMWFRWTYPRLRVDHLMEFAWKWLLPLAFLNLLATGLIYNLVK
ncbi:MAG: NADH-quinone oxidoreductase subunit NuoH [candidate division Zixibacteria bacterium]|nr:NADH-quinone oxidoreductase subunit NuoH [candidate division Zixibacteria bacterium]NIR63683.1 NADH-quinone oxidoreductase subunit NuoH [candidate division Zixibacteria bacterium]NIS18334.1 NADH-quinone oxidoreductase subunit NuoH [candidate division Zixibacteria bacterium]NIS45636.1 NADH-quinone oxidoreductase subunit NuoH [candidate division Zixibacteria bacterium]NIT54661.1 NADH-quinone oxidoreductase subunit NuoH [candidate division Zixibacteria bacterium]